MTSITNLRNLSGIGELHIPYAGTVFEISGKRLGLSALLFATLVSISPVHADWLDDVWSDKHTSRHGHPAITINAVSGVTIVLPEASITEAQAAGVSPQQAAVTFLGKYGPEMCSKITDLNENKPALTIKLVVQYEHALSDASIETQQGVSDATAEVETGRQRHSSGRDIVFEASPRGEVWTIDYVPTHRARCVAPPENDVASTRDSVSSRAVPKNGI
jgi:hypothetical protein